MKKVYYQTITIIEDTNVKVVYGKYRIQETMPLNYLKRIHNKILEIQWHEGIRSAYEYAQLINRITNTA